MAQPQELYDLSPNKDLFSFLEGKSERPSNSANRENPTVYDLVQKALLDATTAKDTSTLVDLIVEEEPSVQVFGECVLAYIASNNADAKNLLGEVLFSPVVLNPFMSLTDPVKKRAMREWIVLLAEYYDEGNADRLLHLRFLQAVMTDLCRPGLVGDSYLALGQIAKCHGDRVKAEQCFWSVKEDMKANLDNSQRNLRFEMKAVRHWYKVACQELIAISEGDDAASIREELFTVQKSEKEECFEPKGAMFGPLAATYLDRQAYLCKLLSEIIAADNLTSVCFRYDYCHEIDTLLFAIEKYIHVLPILKGAKLIYEPEVEEALIALKTLYGEP